MSDDKGYPESLSPGLSADQQRILNDPAMMCVYAGPTPGPKMVPVDPENNPFMKPFDTPIMMGYSSPSPYPAGFSGLLDVKSEGNTEENAPINVKDDDEDYFPKFCRECGAKLTKTAKFCPECGTVVKRN